MRSLAAALLVACATAHAADGAWPQKPVHIIVGYAPGSAMDNVSRLIGAKLTEALGQNVVTENRVGASGIIAHEHAAKQPPDGYTLLMGASSMGMLPAAFGERAVDPIAAFTPIGKLVEQPLVLAVTPGLKADTLQDVLALARASPGTVGYAAGIGTPAHLAMEALMEATGVRFLHVPYSGATMIYRDVISGEVPVTITYPGAVMSLLRSGKLKPIAATGPRRLVALPEVPTIAESGVRDFSIVSWYGLLAPAGTPPEIVARLNREIARILALPDVRETLESTGLEPAPGTPEQLAGEIRASLARWGPFIKRLGIKPE